MYTTNERYTESANQNRLNGFALSVLGLFDMRAWRKRRRRRRKALVILLSALLVLISVRFVFFTPPEVEAAWFDDSYAYRTRYSFTHNAALTDRRVQVTIDTATLITAGKMQSDCDDSRFTDINGKILRHDLTGTCNNASTTYDVLFPTIINGDHAFYHYYGNPSAISASEDLSSFTSLSPSGGAPSAGSEEKGPGPVLYFKFDEGADNTCSGGTNDACDQTSNVNDGAISGGTAWQKEDLCLTGKCLFYDGTDDIVTVTNANSIDFDLALSSAVTFQAWVRVNSDGEGNVGEIFDKGDATSDFTYLRITNEGTDGLADLEASLALATNGATDDATLSVTNGITLNRWHHVGFGYTDDADDEITVYIDGISQGSSTNGVGSPETTDTNNLLLGGSSTANFHGFIDEFKVYDEERTAAEILSDLTGQAALHGTSARFGIRDYSYLSDGLVGYWNMDESSANTCSDATSDSCDSSGNPNSQTDLTWVATAASVTGKFGNGVDFDGDSDYAWTDVDGDEVYDSNTADEAVVLDLGEEDVVTLAAWINIDLAPSAEEPIIFSGNGSSNNQYYLNVNSSSKIEFKIDGSVQVTSTNTISTDTWHHIVATYDFTTAKIFIDGVEDASASFSGGLPDKGDPFHIGGNPNNSRWFDGTIDEARVYNRAFSPSEVSDLYNWAPGPVGYWPMDENTGTTTVYDRSTNANNGTMNGSMTEDDWVPGQYGSGLDFDGTDDDVDAGSDATLDDLGPLTHTAWIFPKNLAEDSQGQMISKGINHTFGQAATTKLLFQIRTSETNLEVRSPVNTLADDNWYHIAVTWDGSLTAANAHLYVNGQETSYDLQQDGTGTRNSDAGNSYRIGARGVASFNFTGIIDEVRTYNYERTVSQIIEDMNAGHPVGGSPLPSQVGYWRFDEGYGDTAQDQTSNNNDGDLAGSGTPCPQSSDSACPTWTNSGKFGKALDFDVAGATDDFIQIDNPTFPTGDFTHSAWVKTPSSSTIAILGASNGAGGNDNEFIFHLVDGNKMSLYLNGVETTQTAVGDYSAWTHVAVTRGGSNITFYRNGVSVLTDSDGAALDISTCPLFIGAEPDSGCSGSMSNQWDGQIDEVKIYNVALTANQVKIDMNQGKAAVFGATSTDSSGVGTWDAANEYCPPRSSGTCTAPVGEWKFDEGTGTTTTNDTSGNGNVGTLTGSMTQEDWVPGKKGWSLEFDGDNDTVDVGDTTSLDNLSAISISAWIYPYTIGEVSGAIICKNDTGTCPGSGTGWGIRLINTDELIFDVDYDTTNLQRITSSNVITYNEWQFVTVTWDGSSDADNVHIYVNGVEASAYSTTQDGVTTRSSDTSDDVNIGNNNGAARTFDGLIDTVRVYNYVRSQAQIAWGYNQGGPVGWWRLDECSGTTANDASGNSNNGTITPGDATGNNDSAGTCNSGASDPTNEMWNAGTTGKRNASLDFDGTNDYVTIGDPAVLDFGDVDFTISAWLKIDTDSGRVALSKWGTAGTDRSWRLIYNSTLNRYEFYLSTTGSDSLSIACGSTNSISLNVWYYITAWHDSVNNVRECQTNVGNINSSSHTGGVNAGNETIIIGAQSTTTSHFPGQIDEVKIFNYVLSEQQKRDEFNAGAVRFGPVEGSP